MYYLKDEHSPSGSALGMFFHGKRVFVLLGTSSVYATTSQLKVFWGPRSHQKQPQRVTNNFLGKTPPDPTTLRSKAGTNVLTFEPSFV